MIIKFGDVVVNDSNIIYDKHIFKEQPNISFDDDSKLYTVMMIDRDAPMLSNGKFWLHWLIINSNNIIVPYNPPTPSKKSGAHRYYVLIFEQLKKLNYVVQFERMNFDVKKFMVNRQLNLVHKQRFKTLAQNMF